jgi:hypothetical protein
MNINVRAINGYCFTSSENFGFATRMLKLGESFTMNLQPWT